MAVASTMKGAVRLDRLRRGALLLLAALFPVGHALWGAAAALVTGAFLAGRSRPRSMVDVGVAAFLLAFLLAALTTPFPRVAWPSTLLVPLGILTSYAPFRRVVAADAGFARAALWALGAGTALTAAVWSVLALRQGPQASTGSLQYNAVGTTMAMGLVALLGLAAFAVGRVRAALVAAAAVTAVALALTFSRGAWLAALVGVLVLLALVPGRVRGTVPLVVIALVLAGAVLVQWSDRLEAEARSIFSLTTNRNRMVLWRISWTMVRDRPLTGSGLNTFGVLYPRYRTPDAVDEAPPFAHNIFLNMAVEGGVLGALGFAAMVGAGFVAAWRWLGRPGALGRAVPATWLATFLALMVHQQVDGTAISFHIGAGLWMLLGIFAGADPGLSRASPGGGAGGVARDADAGSPPP